MVGACWCACVALSVWQGRPIGREPRHGLWRRQGRGEPHAARRAEWPEHPRARWEDRSPGRWWRRCWRWGVRLAIDGDVAAVPFAELAGAWMLLVKVRGGRWARVKRAVNGSAQVSEQHDGAGMRGEPQQRDAQLGEELVQRLEVATADGIRHRIGWPVDVSDLRDGRQTLEVWKSEEAHGSKLQSRSRPTRTTRTRRAVSTRHFIRRRNDWMRKATPCLKGWMRRCRRRRRQKRCRGVLVWAGTSAH